MIEQVGNSVTFLAQFLDGGALKTGLTVTVNVYRVSDESLLVSGAAANEIGASGVYKYTYGPAATEDDYLAVFHTAGVADQVDVPSLWTVGHAGIENLDASVSAAPGLVWDELTASHLVLDSFGEYIGQIEPLVITAALLNTDVTGFTLSDSVGEKLNAIAAAPTVGDIADQVWDEALGDHVGPGSTGKKLTDVTASLIQRSEPPAGLIQRSEPPRKSVV